jgi:hypothetical protein
VGHKAIKESLWTFPELIRQSFISNIQTYRLRFCKYVYMERERLVSEAFIYQALRLFKISKQQQKKSDILLPQRTSF